jgi:hypothetical protein
MRVVKADGAGEVAKLLRALADQVEDILPSVHAVVEFPDDGDTESTILEVRLLHPKPQRWNLVELESALARPGD